MSHPKLELVNLTKEYDNGAVVAVDDISLQVNAGETIALLGSSGCGKSTTLNMIVGLEEPTAGDILIDGVSIVGVPPGKRNVGLVFQDYAVFTSMTVRQNLAFGLEVRKEPKQVIAAAVEEVAELLDMKDRLDARTRDLGGSELQRVAIGRTLVTKPQILLLDEPLSNLEAAARLAMRKELRRLQAEIGLTIVYVTHDQVEALSLADRIAVMNNGKILQVEQTSIICDRPDHIFVADFLGSPPMNLVSGSFARRGREVLFTHESVSLKVADHDADFGELPSGLHTLGVRPEVIKIVAPGTTEMTGQVLLSEPRGPELVLTVAMNSLQLKVVVPSSAMIAEGSVIGLSVDPGAFVYFSNETSRSVSFGPVGAQS